MTNQASSVTDEYVTIKDLSDLLRCVRVTVLTYVPETSNSHARNEGEETSPPVLLNANSNASKETER